MDISNAELGIKTETSPRQLNSENLISFLRGIDDGGEITLDLDKDEFPSGLKLSWAKDYLNEMYANQKTGKHLPEDVQKEIRSKAGENFRKFSA